MATRWGGQSQQLGLWACILAILVLWQRAYAYEPRPVPLVLPAPASSSRASQLVLQPQGLALLAGLRGPVAPVVVIGPYRSGKSFTLNQLLGVPCDQGFGVGHTRSTETKGIWIWGTPIPRNSSGGSSSSGSVDGGSSGSSNSSSSSTGPQEGQGQRGQGGDQLGAAAAAGGGGGGGGDAEETMLLFVDTEGFESTGKADSYDDRIFALSALLSSLLVYNLPETIRESDVAKLSFAVELAAGFYERQEQQQDASSGNTTSSSSSSSTSPAPSSVEPGAMLWLIQRDFLRGLTADQLVAQVLAPVPNPGGDPEVEALNQ
ncbi:hypothetical protein Agub_g7378, partial [Astrephomene gubernaculifera]